MSGPPFPFIVGCGRSGTTMLRSMLDAHPEMSVPPEAQFVVPVIQEGRGLEAAGAGSMDAVWPFLARHPSFRKWELPEDRVRSMLGGASRVAEALRAVFRIYAEGEGKPRYANKTPVHVHWIGLLSAAFTESCFIHLIRDGRDVAVSRREAGFRPTGIVGAARAWGEAIRLGRAAGRRLGGRYLEIRYEDLVSHPESELRRLCAYVELRFDEAMLRYFERPPLRGTDPAVHRHQDRPPTPRMRDWRRELSAEELSLFEALAGETLRATGYELSGSGIPMRVRMRAAQRRVGWRGRRLAGHARGGARSLVRAVGRGVR